MVTILVVDDNYNTRLITKTNLEDKYKILTAKDGKEALEITENEHIDLIIADVMMPIMDGYTLAKEIRNDKNNIPILMVTAKESINDKLTGFSVGVDDYMIKPIDYNELRARIEALLRRANIVSSKKIEIGNVIINEDTYTVSKDDISIELPPKEFELLFKLLSYPGQIFTKNQILDDIWGYSSDSSEDTIKTHISRIRNKLKDFDEFEIITVKGLGYKGEIKNET
ncbi:MAG: response regulator transcription factor [Clostridia bacterium]|nr:response regulator transcription factor [Clostridia bacterium]